MAAKWTTRGILLSISCVVYLFLTIVHSQSADTDIADCSCDLTVNACDINCCCDIECDDADKQVFSTCIDENTPPDSQACVKNTVVFRENTPYTVQTTDDGLFCIYDDNYEERNYYNLPDAINDTEQFDEYKNRYGGYGYEKDVLTVSLQDKQYYVEGDVIYTVYESGTLGVLSQATSLNTKQCVDSNPAEYLSPSTKECIRELSSLAEECMTNPMLDPNIYYTGFKVISTPAVFDDMPAPVDNATTAGVSTTPPAGSTTPPSGTTSTTAPSNAVTGTTTTFLLTTEGPTTPDILYNSTYALSIDPTMDHICIDTDGLNKTCPFDGLNLPQPSYDASTGICSYAVMKVHYTITQNATDGISYVDVQFTFRDLVEESLPFTQAFQTEYPKLNQEITRSLSGRPGYDIGLPVLAGTLNQYVDINGNDKLAIDLSTDPLSGLTIVTSSANGLCKNATDPSTYNRAVVTFGENLRSGCFIQESYSDLASRCQLLQQIALEALRGDNMPNRVATFGDASVELTGDWVEVLDDSLPSTSTPIGEDACRDMITGMHWQIMFANVGDIDNPQAKIIGVSTKYIVQDIKYQCFGVYCQPDNQGLKQRFEVVSSVEFIDASRPSVGETSPMPRISASLPSDFFYPFE